MKWQTPKFWISLPLWLIVKGSEERRFSPVAEVQGLQYLEDM